MKNFLRRGIREATRRRRRRRKKRGKERGRGGGRKWKKGPGARAEGILIIFEVFVVRA